MDASDIVPLRRTYLGHGIGIHTDHRTALLAHNDLTPNLKAFKRLVVSS